MKLPNGNVLLYDNGSYRNFYYDQTVPRLSYTRIAEYEIDELNRTVKLVSEFKYKGINTTITGDIDYIKETKGYLIGYMSGTSNTDLAITPKILELSSSKEVLFEVNVNANRPSKNYYRAERMYLYEGLNQ